jgi:hypothetical protein
VRRLRTVIGDARHAGVADLSSPRGGNSSCGNPEERNPEERNPEEFEQHWSPLR